MPGSAILSVKHKFHMHVEASTALQSCLLLLALTAMLFVLVCITSIHPYYVLMQISRYGVCIHIDVLRIIRYPAGDAAMLS